MNSMGLNMNDEVSASSCSSRDHPVLHSIRLSVGEGGVVGASPRVSGRGDGGGSIAGHGTGHARVGLGLGVDVGAEVGGEGARPVGGAGGVDVDLLVRPRD